MPFDLEEHLESLSLEALKPSHFVWVQEVFSKHSLESLKQELGSLSSLLNSSNQSETNLGALNACLSNTRELIIPVLDSYLSPLNDKSTLSDQGQPVLQTLERLQESLLTLKATEESLTPEHPFYIDILYQATNAALTAVNDCNQIKAVYEKIAPAANWDNHLHQESLFKGPNEQKKMLEYDLPGCSNDLNSRIYLGELQGIHAPFLYKEIKQMTGLYSNSQENSSFNCEEGLCSESRLVFGVGQQAEILAPFNYGASHMVHTDTGQRVLEFFPAQHYLSLSQQPPLGTLSTEAHQLREAIRTSTSAESITSHFDRYFSRFIYVLSNDINELVGDIATTTGLAKLEVFEILKVGQCRSMSMLANYLTQDLLTGGYALGFSVENNKLYSDGAHAKFVFQIEHQGQLMDYECTKMAKFAVKNLNLSLEDKSHLNHLVSNLKSLNGASLTSALMKIKSQLHDTLQKSEYRTYKSTLPSGNSSSFNHSHTHSNQLNMAGNNLLSLCNRIVKNLSQTRTRMEHLSEMNETFFPFHLNDQRDALNQLTECVRKIPDEKFLSEQNLSPDKFLYFLLPSNNITRAIRDRLEDANDYELENVYETIEEKIHHWLSASANQCRALFNDNQLNYETYLNTLTENYYELIDSIEGYGCVDETWAKENFEKLINHMPERTESIIEAALIQSKAFQDVNKKDNPFHQIETKAGQTKSFQPNLLIKDPFNMIGARPYQPGDDTRHLLLGKISTTGELLVKVFGPSLEKVSSKSRPMCIQVELNRADSPIKFPPHLKPERDPYYPIGLALLNMPALGFDIKKIDLRYDGKPIANASIDFSLKQLASVNRLEDRSAFVKKILSDIMTHQVTLAEKLNTLFDANRCYSSELKTYITRANLAYYPKNAEDTYELASLKRYFDSHSTLAVNDIFHRLKPEVKKEYLHGDVEELLDKISSAELEQLLRSRFPGELERFKMHYATINDSSRSSLDMSHKYFTAALKQNDMQSAFLSVLKVAAKSPEMSHFFAKETFKSQPCFNSLVEFATSQFVLDLLPTRHV